ncbi:hypothetical protein Tco_0257292 [Tanacetum coccineum]
MEECHLLLTDQVNLVNPEGHRVVLDVSKPLPLGGPPGQVTIQTEYFFNKDLEYIVSGDKGRRSALSISKLKAAQYLDFVLEELVPSLWIESERKYDISAPYGISHWWFKCKEFYITRHSAPYDRSTVRSHIADYKEYKISEADFKNMHLNDFDDMYLLHLQGCYQNDVFSQPLYFRSEDVFLYEYFLIYFVHRDYFPASSGSSSFNSSENAKDNIIPPILLLHQLFLTPSLVLPPSLLFNPRYFFVPEELLPPKKRICSSSSSSTTLSNLSRNQTRNLVSPSSSVYTPTPPQMNSERMEEERTNGNELKTELKKIRTQIIKLQKKQLGQKDKIAFAHYRISDLEQIIETNQARHQTDQEEDL